MTISYGTVFYNFVSSWSAPIIGVYLLMVILSPYLMKLFSPFDIRRPLILHNFICSAVSLYAAIFFTIGLLRVGNVFSKDKGDGYILHGFMVYWMSKLYELLDTVFMVLRHRTRQISFLHVFHHSSITLLADWGYFITPSPAAVPVLALNSIVHVIMYGYYAVTAIHPLQEFTWKKRITQMQIIQFLIASVHAIIGVVYHNFCIYSLMYVTSMIVLFSNFYYRAFILKKPRRKDNDPNSKKME